MIRYIPRRQTLSASVKDEQIFETFDQMKLFILNVTGRIALYVGGKPFLPDDIIIGDISGNDPMIGLKNVRAVHIKSMYIGCCGE